MKKEELLRRVGSMQQVAYVRPVTGGEGRAAGTRMAELKNGPMQMTVMLDKALDVSALSYKGVNINFLSKPGLQGRNHYDTNGEEALRSIMGGLFFTSGLENICAPCTVNGKDYAMHGRMRTTPAEHICTDARWDGDRYVLTVSGEMRESELFGENLVLRRSITTVYGEKSFTLRDEVENQALREEPMNLLYHINMGYPFLDENTRLYAPTAKVTPRDDAAKGHEDAWDRMDPPKDNEPEYVFIHDIRDDGAGNTEVLVVNRPLGLGLRIAWNRKNLPKFMEWKSTASGDYVIGLEPSNSSVYGRPYDEANGTVHRLAPLAKEVMELTFTVLDGEAEIDAAVDHLQMTYRF